MKYLNMKVKWGEIVHNDNTVKRTTITYFKSKEDMREMWNTRNPEHNNFLNTKELSMSVSEFVSADEYFEWEE